MKFTSENSMKVNQAQENMTKYQQEMEPDQIMMNNNTKAFIKYLEMWVG